MKYAHIEQERRYLVLGHDPYPVPIRELRIRDSYLLGTNLRLRQVDEAGNSTVFKFGQKIRVGNDFQFQIAHTTMYVSADEFDGPLSGLCLIEVDLGRRDVTHAPLPIDGIVEVTNDERFTGGELVKMNQENLRALLEE